MTQQLQAGDEVKQPVGRAVFGVRLEEPVGQHAVLGDAVEHAVGADDGGIDGARQDQEADADHEGFEHQLQPGGPEDVPGQTADEVAAIELHADFVGDQYHGQKADAGREHEAVDEDDESGFLEVGQLRRLDLAVDLGQRLLAAHGQD